MHTQLSESDKVPPMPTPSVLIQTGTVLGAFSSLRTTDGLYHIQPSRIPTSIYFDPRLTPAPITPGSFSSPTLYNIPIANVTKPMSPMVKPASSQNATLTSFF